MTLDLFTIIAPVFLCSAIGFLWVRSGRAYDQEALTALIMNIGAPCLVFSELVSIEVERDAVLLVAAGAVVAMLALSLIGAVLLRVVRLPAHTFLAPLVFGNSGNMGLPLCLFAFGPEGLSLAAGFFATMAVTHFTVGIWIWTGRISFREILRTPLSYAALLAVLCLVWELRVPVWIAHTTQLLGGLTIPLMLITLGVSLGHMTIRRVPRTILLSLLRLLLGFAVGVGVAHGLGLGGVARGVVVLQCSMPVAVFNYLLAQRYGRSPEEVASLVVVSTALAFGLLPVLLAWLL